MEPDLFGGLAEPPPEDLYAGTQDGPPPLRDYQTEAVECVREELKTNRGTLILLATGLGKTQCAAELIRTEPGRSCFIAHRSELINQAAKRIEQFTGVVPHIEKAQDRADPCSGIPVIASIQTLSRESRISRFDPNAFSLIVIDEVHHATSKTYRAVIDYFSGAKIVGLTATPDRLDRQALGQILDSVAYRYDLHEAIEDGWLAKIRMRTVKVEGIDFSDVRTVAGDFNQGDLDDVMAREESLHGVARPAVELSGSRPTIIFTTSIDNARRLAEIIDRYTGKESAVAVDSELSADERRENLRLYESGERQFLVNVGIATEGYDHPPTACIVMGRPTKSRSLFVQMLGRGTRGGENFPIKGKDDLLILDFVGQAAQHDLISTVDALAGDISDEEAELLKEQAEKSTQDLSIEELKAKVEEARVKAFEAREEQRRRRGMIQAEVTYREYDPNPYVALGVKRDYLHERYGYAAATERQITMIRNSLGKNAKHLPRALGKKEASRLIGEIVSRRKKGLCTYPQAAALQKNGIPSEGVTFKLASRLLDAVAKNKWRPLSYEQIERIRDGGPR